MNYNVGIVGLGNFGVAHLEILSKLRDVNVIGVFDKNTIVKEKVMGEYPEVRFFQSLEELLTNEETNVIHVITDESTHYDIGKKVLESNKHLFMEKPITTKHEDALELKALADSRNLKIGVGHLLRHEKKHLAIKERILEGKIGEVRAISLKRNFSKSMLSHYGRINTFVTSMVHDIDLVQFFAGSQIENVAAIQALPERESYYFNTAYLQTKSGVHAHIETIWLLPEEYPYGMEYEVNIFGSKGVLKTRLNPDVEVYNDKTIYEEFFLKDALVAEIESFVTTIVQDNTVAYPTIDEAIHNIAVAESLVQAANIGVKTVRKERQFT
ncbi:putative dehydrogenase [Bacillus mesophilus]|uniref:Gfo/Idh/MocA family oxidoreductase n=1 Tax=Bacillus mesophilus TaxID=1808955 RepID=A0A6M0QA07_9BACI|nr:Gfo/Idh/MocA family oxidoreductase [Bacillus mesophilus]MBM7662278.1 putative dehydrogenase [Bacillus mesophilus]NEY73087.1 Gfo/Idh/MocA family oxidoreductase [Bacillus mesophilus]